jgi:hypothetical protein
MVECGGSPRFSLKPVEGLLIPSRFLGQKFQGDMAAQTGVFGFVDHTHAATAEPLENPIMGDQFAEQRQFFFVRLYLSFNAAPAHQLDHRLFQELIALFLFAEQR